MSLYAKVYTKKGKVTTGKTPVAEVNQELIGFVRQELAR